MENVSDSTLSDNIQKPKSKRGRPKKIKTPEEIEKEHKPKLTLKERQEIKLKRQRERQAANAKQPNIDNSDRIYCSNKDLIAELIKWRDSAEKVEDRVISEKFGTMLMKISEKILNHSNFRNYPHELKEDMQSFFYYKIIKGLKNYNFEFNNPFAFISMCCFNSFLAVICKHYKQLNIKRNLTEKMLEELETYSGINSSSSLTSYMKKYITNNLAELNKDSSNDDK